MTPSLSIRNAFGFVSATLLLASVVFDQGFIGISKAARGHPALVNAVFGVLFFILNSKRGGILKEVKGFRMDGMDKLKAARSGKVLFQASASMSTWARHVIDQRVKWFGTRQVFLECGITQSESPCAVVPCSRLTENPKSTGALVE
ncbi:MAG: hypothetical protein EOP86_27470 [Verrucomicrobiaceae bacterium]|nr:MAG: hypothetical protein EOP86_27470 [Verrucomicrobiaceae bacterium]